MKLTLFQKRCLESYLYMRGKPPTLLRVLSFRPIGWLPFLGIGVASILIFFVDPYFGMFMIGLTLGAVLRIIAHARMSVMGWPVNEQVLDWGRVESLLREDACTAAAPNGGPVTPSGDSGAPGGAAIGELIR